MSMSDYTPMYNSSFEVDHGSGSLVQGVPYHKSLSGPNPNRGTVYAVVGNSGSVAGSPQLNHPLMYYGWGCDTCVGSLVVDIHNDTLMGTYYASSGQVMDEFAILKDLTVATAPLQAALEPRFWAWPNPFVRQLEVEFVLPVQEQVTVQLLDLRGELLATQRLGRVPAGTHRLDLSTAAQPLASGTYLLRFEVGTRVLHEKLVKVNP